MQRQRMGREPARVSRLLAQWPWLIAVAGLGILAAAGFLLLGWQRGKNVGELLQAIDAAHIIPEEDNAAGIYTRLAEDGNLPALDLSLLPPAALSTTLTRPWRSVEFPQVADWIRSRQAVVDALLEAGRKPRCWFAVCETQWQRSRRSRAVQQWSILLRQAANYDLGEGRREAGLEKLLGTLRLGRHLLAQWNPADYSWGVPIMLDTLRTCGRLVVMEDVPPDWLIDVEGTLSAIEDPWEEKAGQLDEVGGLHAHTAERSIAQQLAYTFLAAKPSQIERSSYLLLLSECRGFRLLRALRCHKDQTGAWPASLMEIEKQVPAGTILDPFSDKPFVYRVGGRSFLLYSVGPNGTDEGGKPRADRVVWSE